MIDETVAERQRFQESGQCHPLTCGNDRMDAAHREWQRIKGGDFGQLVAIPGGWVCPVCGWEQDLSLRLISRGRPSSPQIGDELRERLGKIVRDAWVRWASEQESPKPSWLVPWDELSEPDKEADRRIGEALWWHARID